MKFLKLYEDFKNERSAHDILSYDPSDPFKEDNMFINVLLKDITPVSKRNLSAKLVAFKNEKFGSRAIWIPLNYIIEISNDLSDITYSKIYRGYKLNKDIINLHNYDAKSKQDNTKFFKELKDTMKNIFNELHGRNTEKYNDLNHTEFINTLKEEGFFKTEYALQ